MSGIAFGRVNKVGDPMHGKLVELAVNPDGSLQTQQTAASASPAAATSVATTRTVVGTSAVQLSGVAPRGWKLINASTGGQTIYVGGSSVSAGSDFPLAPGAAIGDASLQDLSILYVVASASGAEIRGIAL